MKEDIIRLETQYFTTKILLAMWSQYPGVKGSVSILGFIDC